MRDFKKQLREASNTIEQNIELIEDRGLLCTNILNGLRNFVESASFVIFEIDGKRFTKTEDFQKIKEAVSYVGGMKRTRALSMLHKKLQCSTSHYTSDKDNSTRLIIHFLPYIYDIREMLRVDYEILTLTNLELLPFMGEEDSIPYYRQIRDVFANPEPIDVVISQRFYVHKVKPIIIEGTIIYEVTIVDAVDNYNKFGRTIVYSHEKIHRNYAVYISLFEKKVELFDNDISILFVSKWNVSIRQCEFKNFAKIFGEDLILTTNSAEYANIMNHLKNNECSLVDVLDYSYLAYEAFKIDIRQNVRVPKFDIIMDKCRDICSMDKRGTNIIRYLLYRMNNKVIKLQYLEVSNPSLSDLFLNNKCIPFETHPVCTDLAGHTPLSYDIYNSINFDETSILGQHLSKFLHITAVQEGRVYVKIDEFTSMQNRELSESEIEESIRDYNSQLYYTHKERQIIKERDLIYIKGHKTSTIKILEILKENNDDAKSRTECNFIDDWCLKNLDSLDCIEKKDVMNNIFAESNTFLIYGHAGTGKTTLIGHISEMFKDVKCIFLANTHAALYNLESRVNNSNNDFYTVAKFIKSKYVNHNCELLVIDESSMIGNDDIQKVLEKCDYNFVMFVGDYSQIEPIKFGNWFLQAKNILEKSSWCELTTNYRAEEKYLREMWKLLREQNDRFSLMLKTCECSLPIGESVYQNNENEVVLCLNYGGLYGINSINRFKQILNVNESINVGVNIFKKGDPIIFNGNTEYSNILYNNLKGTIIFFSQSNNKITFYIELNVIDEMHKNVCQSDIYAFSSENGNPVISIDVDCEIDSDSDVVDANLPFSLGYAISIHRAQGLEYDKVKIIISSDVEERINKNILYTAITRAKKEFKIYWSAETEEKVLSGIMTKRRNNIDDEIIKKILNGDISNIK